MTSSPLLSVSSVVAGYGLSQVLNDVSLTVGAGEIVALLGPNGHGKTTLLRVISGLVVPSSGAITFAGEALAARRPDQIVARGVIHIPQGDLIFADMSVQENLLLGAFIKEAYGHRTEQLEKVFAMFPRLRERAGQTASTLSGGERRMLAIGRGLMSRARIILLDEPSLGLAPLVIEEIYATINLLKESGYSILLVEENPERVIDVADRVYLMDHGEIVWFGKGADMLANDTLISTYLGA
jgi:branched-chain amino acid transport system ATP-binding protein